MPSPHPGRSWDFLSFLSRSQRRRFNRRCQTTHATRDTLPEMPKKLAIVALAVLCVAAVVVFAVNIAVHFAARPYLYMDVAAVPSAEAIVVPGAAVFTDG